MLHRETTNDRGLAPWLRGAVLFGLVFFTGIVIDARSSDLIRGTDFPDFYCAARMVLDGHGSQLYDAGLQRQYQAAYSGRIGTLYIHPPFEIVLYLPVAWLPVRRAYLLWSFMSLAALTAGVRCLAKEALPRWNWQVLLASSLILVPLLLCLLQGQDSLFLLLALVFAFTNLRRGQAFAAGCWLGLGLFKFQIILPLALVLILTQSKSRRSAFAKGFSLVAIALAALSVALCGWPVLSAYPAFLAQLQTQPFAGVVPQAMANFRGLSSVVLQRDHTLWTIGVVCVLSAGALIKTLIDHKNVPLGADPSSTAESQDAFDLAFANATMFSLLVSYHLNPHDLTLLLLPISLLLHRRIQRPSHPETLLQNWSTLTLIGVLFLPPLHLWALRARVYAIISIPVATLFLISRLRVRQSDVLPIQQGVRKDQREN